MFRTTSCITAIVLVLGLSAPAFAGQPLSQATDFSSRDKNGGGGGKPSGGGGSKGNTRNVSNFSRSGGGQGGKSKTFTNTTKTFTNTTKTFNVNTGNRSSTTIRNSAIKFQSGPGQISHAVFKPAPNVQFVKLGNNTSWAMWNNGPKRIWWGNRWRMFVPVTALGVVVLGGAYYYPHAYLATARSYCEGITPDGCRLNWQRVDFEDGDADWQCVQYCPRPGAPPPPRTVALVAPPPLPQGGACDISIYSEPNFGGNNAELREAQPHLGDNGWQNQIASVKVKSGTWDFFSDQEFTGETMRLTPGEYENLGPEWAKKAGSFMCVQP